MLKNSCSRRANPNTIQDKFLVGYQGWFTCPGDGEPVHRGHHGWLHWCVHQLFECLPAPHLSLLGLTILSQTADVQLLTYGLTFLLTGPTSSFLRLVSPCQTVRHLVSFLHDTLPPSGAISTGWPSTVLTGCFSSVLRVNAKLKGAQRAQLRILCVYVTRCSAESVLLRSKRVGCGPSCMMWEARRPHGLNTSCGQIGHI